MAVRAINFQRAANEQGAAFRDEAIRALVYAGFEVADTEVYLEDVGIRLDAVTNNQHGIGMAWEFKGSLQGTRPGMLRTDTAKKAIANAVLFQQSELLPNVVPHLVIMTSHVPTDNDSAQMVRTAMSAGWFLQVVDSRDGRALRRLANMTEDEIRNEIARRA